MGRSGNEAACLISLTEGRRLAGPIAQAAGLSLVPLEERNFEGGEFKLRPLQSIRGRRVFVVQPLAGTEEAEACSRLVRLLFLLQGLRDAGADSTVALLPYLTFARKDRRTQIRDPVTSRYVAELLEATQVSCVVGLDVHNPAAFDNGFRIPTIHLSALPMFAAHFAQARERTEAPWVVASPDVGGIKRAQLFRELLAARSGCDVDLAFIEKRRARDVVSGGRLSGDVSGRKVIVLDDLCATGGTLIRAAQSARREGASAVHVAVTHTPLAAGIGALLAEQSISGITVTDSVGIDFEQFHTTAGIPRLTTLSVAPLIGEAVRRMDAGRAIAPLLERWPVTDDM